MALHELGSLKNRYIVCRHGESEANEQGIIISKPENGIPYVGLTSSGRDQVSETAYKIDEPYPRLILVTSPFRRCTETTDIIAETLPLPGDIFVSSALRERDFGDFEGSSKGNYTTVYELDRSNPGQKEFSVESVDEVSERALGLVQDLEEQYNGETIVFVTHADVGEILQASFLGLPPQLHRDLPKLRNAEFRELHLLQQGAIYDQ